MTKTTTRSVKAEPRAAKAGAQAKAVSSSASKSSAAKSSAKQPASPAKSAAALEKAFDAAVDKSLVAPARDGRWISIRWHKPLSQCRPRCVTPGATAQLAHGATPGRVPTKMQTKKTRCVCTGLSAWRARIRACCP